MKNLAKKKKKTRGTNVHYITCYKLDPMPQKMVIWLRLSITAQPVRQLYLQLQKEQDGNREREAEQEMAEQGERVASKIQVIAT